MSHKTAALIYKNVFKLDVASLYPSIIRQYKIYNKQKDPEANFLNIIETLTLDRLKDKKLAKETGLKYYKDLISCRPLVIDSIENININYRINIFIEVGFIFNIFFFIIFSIFGLLI
jgi:DNA polymerase elongation subunit (family B)